MPNWPFWLVLFAVLAAALTAGARAYALRKQLVDQPGERRSHSVATPRGGGISIVIALLIAAGWLAVDFPGQRQALAGFCTGLLLVAGIGWIDDHRPLSPWLRLAVHVLAASVLAVGLWISGTGPWVAIVAWFLTIGLVNIWNFMDGINGLAASQAGLISAAIALTVGGAWSWLAGAFAASTLGFLPFNYPKARIFLGDVGSGALGFALAALLAISLGANPSWSWLTVAILPVTFIVDASCTLMSRILKGEAWWTPHVQHAYQIWGRRWGHIPVTLGYGVMTLVATAAFLYGSQAGHSGFVVLFIICYTLCLLLWGSSRKSSN